MSLILALTILILMSGTLFDLGQRRGDGSHVQGLRSGGRMFVNLLPLLLLAFVLAGLIQVALPPELIHSWLGEEAGLRGVVVGVFAGSLIMGGPYAAFPVIAGIYNAGAGMATAVAMISGWALLGITQFLMGLAFIGIRFTLVRTGLVLFLPFLAGIAAHIWFVGW